MLIVETDNCGGDYPDEKFLLWNMPEAIARKIATAVNEAAGENSTRYWKVEEEGYILQPGFEP